MKLTQLMQSLVVDIPRILSEPSYYPERRRKSYWRRWAELVYLRLFGKFTDFYYNAYGKDCSKWSDAGYLEESDFWRRIIPLNYLSRTANYAVILHDKLLFDLFMREHNVRVATSVGHVNYGRAYLNNIGEVGLSKFIDELKRYNEPLFVKDAVSSCARGVVKIEKRGDELVSKSGSTVISEKYFEHGKFVIQKALLNCDEIKKIQPNSVNTLRIVTLMNKKTNIPELLSPGGLRIGGGGDVDNWAAGGLFVGLTEEGKLNKFGYYKPGKSSPCRIAQQPQTGFVFDGFFVPFYKEAVKLVLKAHSCLPELFSIGWDVAVTPEGPVLIEGNEDWEITLMQIVAGGLKKRFVDVGVLKDKKDVV